MKIPTLGLTSQRYFSPLGNSACLSRKEHRFRDSHSLEMAWNRPALCLVYVWTSKAVPGRVSHRAGQDIPRRSARVLDSHKVGRLFPNRDSGFVAHRSRRS